MPDWTPGKQKRVCLLLGLILLLTASFLTFDWTQYWFGTLRIADPERMYTRIAKTLTSLLVAVLALNVGDDGIDERDPLRLRRAFAAILTGDLLFLLDEIHPAFDYPAIVAFLIAHVLIIVRNGHGLRSYWHQATGRRRAVDVALAAVGRVEVVPVQAEEAGRVLRVGQRSIRVVTLCVDTGTDPPIGRDREPGVLLAVESERTELPGQVDADNIVVVRKRHLRSDAIDFDPVVDRGLGPSRVDVVERPV